MTDEPVLKIRQKGLFKSQQNDSSRDSCYTDGSSIKDKSVFQWRSPLLMAKQASVSGVRIDAVHRMNESARATRKLRFMIRISL